MSVKPEILPQRDSHFSWLRTRLSIERTMTSWMRTATAMIGFGFTIFQFFDRLNSMEGVAPARHPTAILIVSLSLVAIGSIGLVVAMIEYRRGLRYLWSPEFRDIAGMEKEPITTPTLSAALLLAFVGILTFGTLVWRTTGF
ncbi:MAG TPA: DUF202 domain-containing protein [Longimicrobiales bacterium]|nr:DUF202 domain-containing protein [Longimicrobiales bacterium]